MPTRAVALALCLAACGEPAGPSDPTDGDPGTGQTGQSGTEPPTCRERFPDDPEERYPSVDEPTSLGLTAREALASLVPASAELTWNDGATTTISLVTALAEDATEVTVARSDAFEDCRFTLSVRATIALSTADGQLDAMLVTNDGVEVWAEGEALVGDGFASTLLDLSPWGAVGDTSWLVSEVHGPDTSGSLSYRSVDGSDSGRAGLVDVATW